MTFSKIDLFINQVIIDHLYYVYKCCISFSHFIYLIVFNHSFIIACNFDKDKQKKVDGFYDICFIVLFVFWDFIEPANPKKAWLFNLVCYKDHWLTLTFFFTSTFQFADTFVLGDGAG